VSRLAVGDRVIGPAGDGRVIASQVGADGPEAKVEWPNGVSRWYPASMLARKRGRPPRAPGGDDGTRCVSLSIRLHPVERDAIVTAAANSGLSVADYVRGRLAMPPTTNP
jgi:hypothetical protein